MALEGVYLDHLERRKHADSKHPSYLFVVFASVVYNEAGAKDVFVGDCAVWFASVLKDYLYVCWRTVKYKVGNYNYKRLGLSSDGLENSVPDNGADTRFVKTGQSYLG